jgi:hypothetical protein
VLLELLLGMGILELLLGMDILELLVGIGILRNLRILRYLQRDHHHLHIHHL